MSKQVCYHSNGKINEKATDRISKYTERSFKDKTVVQEEYHTKVKTQSHKGHNSIDIGIWRYVKQQMHIPVKM